MSRKRFWKPLWKLYPSEPERSDYRRAVWLRGRTVDRFARQIASLEELELAVQAALRQTLRPDEPVHLIINAPFQAYLRGRRSSARGLQRPLSWFQRPLPWEYSPDWVMVLAEDRLLLLQRVPEGQPLQVISIPLECIFALQNGTVLLFSWFEVQWVEDGAVRQQTIYFNTVCTALFARLCELIRWKLASEAVESNPAADCSQAALEPLPYKFKNMIPLHALLNGEQVIEVMYRPALWKKRMVAFRTMTVPRLVAVLTNLHLILAEEDLTGTEGSYGFISTFLPLSRVVRVDVAGQRLVISLLWNNAGKMISVDFPALRLEEAARLAAACEQILPKAVMS